MLWIEYSFFYITVCFDLQISLFKLLHFKILIETLERAGRSLASHSEGQSVSSCLVIHARWS